MLHKFWKEPMECEAEKLIKIVNLMKCVTKVEFEEK